MQLCLLNTVLSEAAKKHWGFHLLIDAAGCNANIESEQEIRDFLKELVPAIDMKAVGKPVVKDLLAGDPKAGFSAMQLIETSSITFHLVNGSRTCYLDVFSCKDFDQEDVIKILKKHFGCSKIKRRFLYRDAE